MDNIPRTQPHGEKKGRQFRSGEMKQTWGGGRQINRLKDGAGIEETGKIKGKRQKQAGQAKKKAQIRPRNK